MSPPPWFSEFGKLAVFACSCFVASTHQLHAAAPTAIALDSNELLELTPPDTVIANLSVTDADENDSHVFELVEGEGSWYNFAFHISGNTLRYTYLVSHDVDTAPLTVSIRLRVTDSTQLSHEQVFTLDVTDNREEDSDRDGLTEAVEEDEIGTSDLIFDFDGDGVGDGAEVAAQTSPLDANVWPPTSIIGWGNNTAGERVVPAGTGFVGLETGQAHSLAVNDAGQVFAWGGQGTYGQTVVPEGLGNVVAVAAGGDYWLEDSSHSLALKDDGTVVAWGYDHGGRIVVPADLDQVIAIAAGRTHCLALRSNGMVVAWGYIPDADVQPPVGLDGVIAISAGGFHSVALKHDGSVVTWGSVFDGVKWHAATVPVGLSDVIAISAGRFHTLALKSDGTVVAWGYNSHGQTAVPAGLTDVIAVAAGGFHSLALKRDGSVVAWGMGSSGQTTIPNAAQGGIKRISAGILHSLAVRQNDGYPRIKIVDTDTPESEITGIPQLLGAPGEMMGYQVSVVDAVATAYTVDDLPEGLVIDSGTGIISGTPLAAARRSVQIRVETDKGLLTQAAWIGVSEGSAPTSIALAPAVVSENAPAGTSVGSLSAIDPDENDSHTFELVDGAGGTDNGLFEIAGTELKLRQAMSRDFEQNPASFSVRVRARDASLNPFEQSIVIQFTNDTGEDADGDGLSEAAEAANLTSDTDEDSDDDGFGDGFEVSRGFPPMDAALFPTGRMLMTWGDGNGGRSVLPADLADVVDVSAGLGHSLALKANGIVVAWGENASGQASVPDALDGPEETDSPEELAALKYVTAVEAGDRHSLALTNEGMVIAWGENDFGQTNVPEGLTGVVAISAGSYHNLALKSDGSVVAWGYNQQGQATVPEDLTGVVAVAAGGFHSLALKSDGTVVSWGSNLEGVLAVPAGLAGVTAISAGGVHSLALKYDGTVVAWGINDDGQSLVPHDLSGVTAISAGWYHSLALMTDGSMRAWGDNAAGQALIPMEGTQIRKISAGGFHNLAVRQSSGFPGFPDVSPIRSWAGEVVSRSFAVDGISSYTAMGLPADLTMDPVSGLVSGTIISGERRAVRVSALGGSGLISQVVWFNTADGIEPTDIALSSTLLAENSPADSWVADISSTDPNGGDVHNFDLVYVDGAPDSFRFMVSGNQLRVRYDLGTDYDAGQTGLVIRIVAVDSGNNRFEKNFTLQLTDDRLEDGDGDGISEANEEDVLGSSDASFDDFNILDTDGDGVPSLLEFAFNLPPSVAGPPVRLVAGEDSIAGLPAVDLVTDGLGQSRLRMEYIRRTGGTWEYIPQFSSGLNAGDWVEAVNPIVTPFGTGWERCVILDTQTSTSSSRRFARVLVKW